VPQVPLLLHPRGDPSALEQEAHAIVEFFS
jgi:hypothetical protein